MENNIIDHIHSIKKYIEIEEVFHPSSKFFPGSEGVQYTRALLDGEVIKVTKAEREIAVILVHTAFRTYTSKNILGGGTKVFREIIEEALGIKYMDEEIFKYATGKERVRNFILGRVCSEYSLVIQNINDAAITDELMEFIYHVMRGDTLLQYVKLARSVR